MLKHESLPHSSLWLNNIPLYGLHTFCLSIHQLMDIWVVSTFLAIMNNVANNIHVQVFVSTYVFTCLRHIPRS